MADHPSNQPRSNVNIHYEADGTRVVTDLECVMSSWWLVPEAGAGEAAVEDAGAVLELA